VFEVVRRTEVRPVDARIRLPGGDLLWAEEIAERCAANCRAIMPEIYQRLDERDVEYAIRLPANKTLELAIEDILFRPRGRPSCKHLVRYKSFEYQADSSPTPRRVVAKVEHHAGELFPRVGFIVTNMALPS
jgi:Transposase DDE domain group 1